MVNGLGREWMAFIEVGDWGRREGVVVVELMMMGSGDMMGWAACSTVHGSAAAASFPLFFF